MAKIQPLPAAASPSSSSADECQSLQLRGEQVYTVWMKSLVFNGNGCTVYGADGGVAFRVDNYGCRGGREVFFMDRAGKTLIRIQRKSFGVFRRKGGAAVTMHGGGRTYAVEGCSRKSDYKIRGAGGAVVAVVARKQTASGVVLGEDVLTLTVGSEVDHLLVLGMVVVCGLMNRCM
ncbi:protein LURP-one-related 11-like [Panicum miliaceum]|uniref:Protein LURP-one-related 11-like n=1 Tax=Panicum miliaceum TaxID=4540 RepID=A0A3L6SKN4_PANMI|nr:protein LURP-one-related 11-like [Panicum miliaceum]